MCRRRIDADRYRTIAWLAVGSRLAGVLFFLTQPADYRMLGAVDLVFFVPEAILLALASRREREPDAVRAAQAAARADAAAGRVYSMGR